MLEFIDILQAVIDYIYDPIHAVLNDHTSLTTLSVSMGFGQINWFTVSFDTLLYFVISLFVYYLVVRATYRFILLPLRIIRGQF